MREQGAGLLSVLSSVNYPAANRFTPEAFDWMYEDVDNMNLLGWISETVTVENYLPPEDLDAYQQIPKGEILTGPVLEAAIEAAKDQDTDLSMEDLEHKISLLEAELGWNESSLETLTHLRTTLVEKTNQDSLHLGSLATEAERETREERRVHDQVLQVNDLYNSALHKLRSSLEGLVSEFTKYETSQHNEGQVAPYDREDRPDDRVHLYLLRLDQVQEKEQHLDRELGLYIDKQFGTKFSKLAKGISLNENTSGRGSEMLDVGGAGILELVRGRDMKEFLHLKSEINRVRVSIFRAEMQRIETSVQAAGLSSSLAVLNRYLTGSQVPDPFSTHPSALAKPLLVEPSSKIDHQISSLVAECLSCQCHQILTTDYKLKHRRSIYIFNKLKMIRDVLLRRHVLHEILVVLLVNESEEIIQLLQVLKDLEENLELRKRSLVGMKGAVRTLGTKHETESLILPQDSTFSNLHKILRISGLVGPLATYSGVESAINNLSQNKSAVEKTLAKTRAFRLQSLENTNAGIHGLCVSLHLNPEGGNLSLVPREISRGICNLRRGLHELELRLKGLMTEWEEHRTQLRIHPYRRQQRELWIEFVLRPKDMPSSVRAVQNKARD